LRRFAQFQENELASRSFHFIDAENNALHCKIKAKVADAGGLHPAVP
jgi:hypothetical protein